MTRRRYRLGRRADAATATQRRIVEATLAVHDEQGISATSVRDIAQRAGVAPSTVLHHFPVMDELIRACGELSEHLLPMPSEAVLAGASGVFERVHRMARAMFEWWNDMGPGFDHLRIDRRRIPEVDAWMAELAQRHRALAAAALGDVDDHRVPLFVALTSADAWAALRGTAADPAAAAVRVATLLLGSGAPKESTKKETVH
ncbi:MAG: TetR/AcrR family transcriptional regulator [Candidatus Limnocylindria bacterium]